MSENFPAKEKEKRHVVCSASAGDSKVASQKFSTEARLFERKVLER